MPYQTPIATFWSHLATHEAELLKLPLRERVEQANEWLGEELQNEFALEMQGDDTDEVLDLILTAHGNIELFPWVMHMRATAPALRHFRVKAFRERTSEPDFPIQMDEFALSTTDVQVALDADQGQIALEIAFNRDIPMYLIDHAKNMTFIMLDHVLGEYDFAVKVGAVDFVGDRATLAAQHAQTHRLADLQAPFDEFWRSTLGRTGTFPTGEQVWRGLELRFNDEADDPQPPEGDEAPTAIVSINASANAVAMRADLTCALTLSVSARSREELDSAHALEEQVTHIFESTQQGILSFTMLRLGQRKAVYYTQDEAQALALLKPFGDRIRTQGGQATVQYDPTWTEYFEFASVVFDA